MSQTTIDILNTHRDDQLRLSPSSEEFTYSGGSFFGIFDRAHLEDNKDKGNIRQKKLTPLIMVSEVPVDLVENETLITRENGIDSFTFFFKGLDAEGVPIIWLS